MEYVALGKSELISSIVGLGGGSSGRFGLTKGGTKSDAIALIHRALDLGVTFFDASGITGGVDELLADGLDHRRNDVLLSTKIHLGPEPAPFSGNVLANKASSWTARRLGFACGAATIRRRVEQSLNALRTDRIDLLHLHAVSPRQYRRATAAALPELRCLKREGKIRAIGVTEAFLSDPGHEMLREAVTDAKVDAVMVGFNLENPSAAEFVLPRAKQEGIATIGMFSARTLLASAIAEDVKRVASEYGINSVAELAYRFARHQPGLDIVLTGTGNPAHLEQNVAAALAPPLPAELLDRLSTVTA